MLPSILVRNDNHETRNLAADHPLVELAHDALDVRLYLVVGGDCALSAGVLLHSLFAVVLTTWERLKASSVARTSSEELLVRGEGGVGGKGRQGGRRERRT